MGWLQRTFPRLFGPEVEVPAAAVEKAAEVAGQVFGAPMAKEEAYGLLAGVLPFGLPPRRGTKELLSLYGASPWLRVVVSRIASRVGQTEWHVMAAREPSTQKDMRGQVVRYRHIQRAWSTSRRKQIQALKRGGKVVTDEVDHPMLQVLHDGCPVLDGLQVQTLASIYYELKGEAFMLIERHESGPLKGRPRYLWPIPPYWVLETPTVSRPGYRIQYLGFSTWVPETEIVAIRDPNPAMPYGRATGIGESLADELSADEAASKLVDSSFYNRNLPAAIVSMEAPGAGGQAEATRIKADWEQKFRGVYKAFQTYFTNAKVTVNQLSQTFADMQVLELRKQLRDNILEAWGYPKELLGIMENANRSTVDVVDYFKEKYIVEPRREVFRHAYQDRLMPEWDERGIVEYTDEVPQDREFALKTMQTRPAAFTDDEVRDLAGYEPLPNGKGSATGAAPAPSKPPAEEPAAAADEAKRLPTSGQTRTLTP